MISGDGQVNQIGTGTTILTGDSTYTGRTTISSGVLQLGDSSDSGITTGSIVSDVVNNAILAIDHSDTVILPGQITGTGALRQIGTGTTILTANNTYSGGTFIDQGALQLGDGGTGGNVFGDIVNEGTLVFDRSDLLPIIGSISGTGGVEQNGTGETVLFGVNSYSGPTDVKAGRLYVNGNNTLATGLTTVNSGATLGGAGDGVNTGIIGGSVTVASGGTLSPGDVGDFPGTLTINQDLTLQNGAVLDYSFGEANVPGGPLNDLTVVHGDLTLAGTINVSLSEGGSFDVGIYRVISYDGGLTNNTLAIGAIPAGTNAADYFVQTSIANQVNLAYTAGLELNFWDGGDANLHNNNGVNGGNGVWHATQGTFDNKNWTDQFGVPNAPWASEAFAIFSATPGTVIVDEGIAGEVRAAGMQFASNGYVIQGDPITLVTSAATPGRSIIRVGDGSSLGSGYTAIIRSILRGDITLTKTDIGTLVLTGDNTYTGGTAITGGVLEISRDTNLGLAGTMLSMNNGTLRTTATMVSARDTLLDGVGGIFETVAGTSFTNSGVISGDGPLTKTGDGTLILTGENIYTGLTTISQGTLQLGDGGSSGNLASRVWNNSILAFNRSDEFVFGSAIFGTGAVEQIGSGTTVLTATNTYEGPTTVSAGTLQAGATNTFSPNSEVTVAPGATLDLDGFDQTIPELTNAGTVLLNGAPGTVLTVRGDYTGFGGTMVFNTYLGSDTSPSDRLVIDGGVGDDTGVLVNNIGGPGARTTGDGILLVEAINGATTTTTAFALAGPVVAGPYEYSLYRGGSSGGSPDNWFLRSVLDCSLAPTLPECQNPPGPTPPPHYRPETSLYTAIPSLALAYDNVLLDTLDQRMGGLRSFQGTGSNRETNDPAHLAWGRIVRLNGSRDGDTHGIYDDAGPDYDYTFNAVQVGTDLVRNEHADGSFDSTGLYLAYGHSEADVDHFDRTPAGTDKLDGWTIGGYWTHFGASGWYVDTVVQGTWYDIKTEGRLPEMTTDGFGLGASLEAGYPFHCANTVVVEPQAQVTYQTIDLDDTRDVGSVVRFSDVDSLVGRLGVRLSRSWKPAPAAPSADKQRKAATVWVRASLVNEFLGRPETRFSSADGYIPFQTDTQGAGYVIDTGIDAEITDNISLYGNLLFQNRFDGDDHAFGGQLGLKIKF
ncbi:autotransporter outer membrane beta-barrel domain-containing protein [Desulfobulbus elongatus]|uniref:autotransporter outer membrane beta-barrel domain-containing protein n=1 Tax=Desulfobulbus elongatus TaxID=53332 RepID=UPI00316AEDF0